MHFFMNVSVGESSTRIRSVLFSLFHPVYILYTHTYTQTLMNLQLQYHPNILQKQFYYSLLICSMQQ